MSEPAARDLGGISGTGCGGLGDARRGRARHAPPDGRRPRRGHRHGDHARAESLQDVPESISAFDTNAIAMRGLQQMDDYAKYVPGLSLAQREPGGTTIVFRGVASSGLQFGAVSSSALYLDEQPITQSGRNPDPRLIDIERIEALRGPQGTLYGASSQSGTLRVITNKPDPSELRRLGRGAGRPHRRAAARATTSAPWSTCRSSRTGSRCASSASRPRTPGYIDNVLDSPEQLRGRARSTTRTWSTKDVNSVETTRRRARRCAGTSPRTST